MTRVKRSVLFALCAFAASVAPCVSRPGTTSGRCHEQEVFAVKVNCARGSLRRHALFLLGLAAFAGPVPAEAALSATQTLEPTGSAFAFASEPGDSIGGGQTRLFTPDESTFTSSFDGTTFAGSITSATSWWSVEIGAPPGQSLTVGAYENAVRFPFNGPGQPGLSVTGEGRGCNTVTGRFVVARVEQAGDSLAFEAAFEQHCEGGAAALFGQIRIGPAGVDTLAPSLALPGNLTIDANGPTPVAYAVSAVDLGDSNPTVACTPSSGSVFRVGTTTVTCTATDSSTNETTRTFQVRVRTSTPLSLAVSKQTINFGRSVRVTAHLSPFQDTGNEIVSIYARPYGGQERCSPSAPSMRPATFRSLSSRRSEQRSSPSGRATTHMSPPAARTRSCVSAS